MTDREFLIWIHQRLINVHGEDPLVDYMGKLRCIIAKTPGNKTTPNDGAGGNNIEDLTRRLEEDAPETSAMDRSDLTSFGRPRYRGVYRPDAEAMEPVQVSGPYP